MQTLFLSVADCPTGTLSGAARYVLDAKDNRLLGATLIAAQGEPVTNEPEAEGDEPTVIGYNFNAGHIDANCPATLGNALALFGKASEDLGSGDTPDADIVYDLVRPLIKPRVFRKIMIELALAEAGILPALDAYLASIELKPGYTAARAWNTANELSEDFPNYDQYFAAAKKALGISDAQAEAILEKCVA